MLILNTHADHGRPLTPDDASLLGPEGTDVVAQYLALRSDHARTPLVTLPGLAKRLGVGALHVKDEGQRLGLGSFKALGGAYAVMRLTLEEASRRLGRPIAISELSSPAVREIAGSLVFACATDGNHGRSVAQGAQFVGAASVVFVHARVSDSRVAAIARFGARMVRVAGTYDDSVAEAASVAAANGWTVVSDTSWPGYDRIPSLVMQGYTVLVQEALQQLPSPPTHVFVQAGVGGIAAAAAGHLAVTLGDKRPTFVVVEPSRAACLFETVKAGHPVKVPDGEPTVMAMLECYEPSLAAWRVLAHVADAFMTVEDEDAIAAVRRLANPETGDIPVVAGESGCVGLAGLTCIAGDTDLRARIGLDADARVLIVNTEGATDPARYTELVGRTPQEVLGAARAQPPA
ncbi:MAG: diaminopropionate ammonia-lyase [Hyphomicrobiaceae bacterium]